MILENCDQWIQLNVGLVRHNGDALPSARTLFAQIYPLLERWRELNCLQCFFFMRKFPDVRMRFLMSAYIQESIFELKQQMELLQNQGAIREFFFSNYEAEIERFGGIKAMHYVHQYFDQDTSIWLLGDRLSQQQRANIAPAIFLPIVFHDLFQRTLVIPEDIKKAWLALASLTPIETESIIPEVILSSIDILCCDANTTPEQASLLFHYKTANQALAEGLIQLNQTHQLTESISNILATIALFNFNRHGFGGDRSSVLVQGVLAIL